MAQRTIDQAAQILGVTTAVIWRRIRQGQMQGLRDGGARETRLLVNVPEPSPVAARPAPPATLARELRGDIALLVTEMDAYRDEADDLVREHDEVRDVLEGALGDLAPLRATEAVGRSTTTPTEEVPDQTAADPQPTPTPIVATERTLPTPPETSPPPVAVAEPEPPATPATPEPVPEPAPEPRLEPVSRFLDAGVRLHYLEWTPTRPIATPPVVLLHGISGNARNYDALTAALGERFHLYALDLRGHDDSGWDERRDYRISALVYDLNLLIDDLGLSQVILVGTGLGADVALGLVSARPAIVRGLVLNDSGPEAGSSGLKRVLEAIREAPTDFDDIAGAMAWWREHYPSLSEYDDGVVAEFIDSTLRASGDGRLVWKFDPALRAIDDLGALRDVDLSVAVGRISCPTLVVRGEYSDVLGRDAARRLRGRVRGATFVEAKGVAHAPSLVEEDVLPALESFLRSIGQEGPVAAF